MPVTIKAADHAAGLVRTADEMGSSKNVLDSLSSDPRGTLLQSSLDNNIPPNFRPNANGFVNSVRDAFNHHHHLVIRPDDIWIAIMTQFNFYVNAHAEELRSQFVAHDGQKSLKVVYFGGNRFTGDYADFVNKISDLIEENVVDPTLREWIQPSFSTTTPNDTVVASVVMMGTLQAYFEYRCCFACGIPSVTLLGEKEDYENILQRLEKLSEFGEEPAEFRVLLTTIVERLILCFDDPECEDARHFWENVAKIRSMSGSTTMTGWITAFCAWNSQGKFQLWRQAELQEKPERMWNTLSLGGVYYSGVEVSDIPSGYTTVPVTIDDNGVIVESEMLAGSVGIQCTSSGKASDKRNNHQVGLDTMQPHIGWFMYEK